MSTIHAPAIHDLFNGSFAALTPAAIDIDRPRLIRRLRATARSTGAAFDPLVEHLRRDGFRESNIIPYTHRPFDMRWLYVDPAADRDYLEHVAADTVFIGVAPDHDLPVVTRRATAELETPLRLFPLLSVTRQWSAAERKYEMVKSPNLTGEAADYVRRTGVAESDLFHHTIAMLGSRRHTNHGRVPLPEDKAVLRDSALLGYRFASVFIDHDPLVVMTPQELALRAFGVPSRLGREARMLRGSVLCIDDRWGSGEMIETRIYKGEELQAIADYAELMALSGDDALSILGRNTCDVYLNDKAVWRNVPINVWRYTQRGVPLLKSWLCDRTATALGRGLLREEVTHFSTAVKRIVTLLLLGPALKRNGER